jgi:hypothetical protein
MTNDIVPNIRTNIDDYIASGGQPLILFKMGDYYIGDDEIPHGKRFVAKPREQRIGYMRWEDDRPAQTIAGYLHDGYVKPFRDTLGYLDEKLWKKDKEGCPRDPIQDFESIPMISDSGEEFLFTTSSFGGHRAPTKLQKAYRDNGSCADPVIEIGSEKRKNKNGNIYAAPIFTVAGWVGAERPTAQVISLPKTTAETVQDEIPDYPAPKKSRRVKGSAGPDDGLPSAWD